MPNTFVDSSYVLNEPLIECVVGAEVGKKEPSSVWTVLKNYFLKIWKITMGTLYIKRIKLIETNSYTFKVVITKFPLKFTLFQKFFYMFKAIKKSRWTSGFFCIKSLFSLIKCSPNHFNFFMNFNIFHKKGSMCSKYSKNIYIYFFLDFNTQMSFYTIIDALPNLNPSPRVGLGF
jgi:hypothetical protein